MNHTAAEAPAPPHRPRSLRTTLWHSALTGSVAILSFGLINGLLSGQLRLEPADWLKIAVAIAIASPLILQLNTRVPRARTAITAEALMAAMTDVILVLDDTGRYLQIAPTNPQQLYRPPQELQGRTLHDVFAQERADEFLAAIRRALTTQQPVTLDYALPIDGSAVWFAASVSRLSDRTVIWVARDVTARHQTELDLEREREVLGFLLENTADTIYLKDTHSRFTRINRAQAATLGVAQPQDAIGKTDADFFAPELAAQLLAEERHIFETGQPVLSREEYNPHPDGRPRWLSASKNALYDGDGRIIGLVGISHDITAVKLREREFSAIAAVAAAVRSAVTRADLLDAALEPITDLMRADGLAIGLCNANAHEVTFEAACGVWAAARGAQLPLDDNFCAEIIRAEQPFLLADVSAAAMFSRTDQLGEVKQLSAAPLMAQGELLGLLVVSRQTSFSAEERRQFMAVSDVVAGAVQRALAHEQAQYRADQLAALNLLGRALAGILSEPEIYARLAQAVLQLLPESMNVIISLYDDQAQRITCVYAISSGVLQDVTLFPPLPLGHGPQSTAIRNRRSVIANDWPNWPAHSYTLVPSRDPADPASILFSPMLAKDQVVGVIQVQSHRRNCYTWEDAELLTAITSTAAIAILNARLFEREREQRAVAEALRDITAALTSTLNFDEVLDRILANVSRIVPNDVASIMLIEHGVARIMRTTGLQDPEHEQRMRQTRFQIEQTPTLRQLVVTRQPQFIVNTATHPDWTKVDGIDWIKSNVAAPISVKDRVIGVLTLDSATPNFYSAVEAERLHLFAGQAAVALGNAQLFDESQRRLAELAILFDSSRAITATLDRDAVIQTITQRLAEAVDATSAYVLAVDLDAAIVISLGEYYSPAASERERVNDPEVSDTLDDLPQTLAQLREGRPCSTTIDQLDADPADLHQLRKYGIQSSLRVPMIVSGTVRGYALLWDSRTPRRWTAGEVQLCQTLANLAASALENVRLLEETRQGLREQSALLATSTAVSSTLDLDMVLQRLAEQICRAVDTTSVYVCQWNQAANTSTVVVDYYGPEASEQERESDLGATYPLTENYGPDLIWTRPGGVLVTHADSQDILPSRAAHLRHYGCQSVLTVGLTARAKAFGYIELWETRRRRTFTPEEIALCQAIAQQAAIAYENARLFEAERKQLRLAQTLQMVGTLLIAQMSLDAVYQKLFDLLARVVHYDSVSVQLLEGDRLTLAAGLGFPDVAQAAVVATQLTVAHDSPKWDQPVTPYCVISDTHADPNWVAFPGTSYIRSWVGAALRVKGRQLGILNVDSATPGEYTEETGETVAAFANQAAIAIENAQLHEAVRRHADQLEERVRARTLELEQERKRTAAILDTAGEGIIYTDATGMIEYANQAMAQLTGYSVQEALGQNASLWKSDQTPPALYRELWSTILSGRVWQGELVNRRKNGHLYDAALTIAPLRDSAGHIAGFVGVQRDITHRKELDRLKDEFVSNVSHELRTPIANVKLYISLLMRGKPERHDDYLQTLRREAARLENLIEDLLDLSRLDLGSTAIELTPVDLKQLVSQLIADRLALAAGRQHAIELNLDAPDVLALADPTALGSVISNLLTNAINYTPPGGRITVSAAYRPQPDRTWATITVADSGPGIAKHDLPHLFDRFYRGEAGRRSGMPGTGLGLAISYKIISRLDGQITVESRPGHGAAFTIWLKTP